MCGQQELYLLLVFFPYMLLILMEFVESKDNIKQVKENMWWKDI